MESAFAYENVEEGIVLVVDEQGVALGGSMMDPGVDGWLDFDELPPDVTQLLQQFSEIGTQIVKKLS